MKLLLFISLLVGVGAEAKVAIPDCWENRAGKPTGTYRITIKNPTAQALRDTLKFSSRVENFAHLRPVGFPFSLRPHEMTLWLEAYDWKGHAGEEKPLDNQELRKGAEAQLDLVLSLPDQPPVIVCVDDLKAIRHTVGYESSPEVSLDGSPGLEIGGTYPLQAKCASGVYRIWAGYTSATLKELSWIAIFRILSRSTAVKPMTFPRLDEEIVGDYIRFEAKAADGGRAEDLLVDLKKIHVIPAYVLCVTDKSMPQPKQ